MNSKERVYAALKHEKTDRIPKFVWLGTGTIKRLTKKLEVTPLELDIKFGNDVLQTWVSINGEMARDVPENTKFTDEWGITWKREGDYNMVINHPLKGKDLSFIINYQLPDPYNLKRYEYLEHLVKEYGDEYFIGADVSGVLFEPAYHLRDMEELMVDMAMESEEVDILLDKLSDFCIAVSIECIKRGADWVWLGDDLGSQNSMLMSPDMWRKYFKPRMKKIIDSIRAFRKDITIAYHSCGSIYPVLGDLVDIGINVLNPIQESAQGMDQSLIKKKYGDKITLMCGVDTQQFLIHATPEEVKNKVIDIIDKLGYNGGFIFAASHHIQPDTPDKNIFALFDALEYDNC
jgi:uroporphyrinogen decarboxylase